MAQSEITVPIEEDENLEDLEMRNISEIERLTLSKQDFEILENEYKSFVTEISKERMLERFKEEYDILFKIIRNSYEKEIELVKKCKEMSQEIYSKASQVKLGISNSKADAEQIKQNKEEVENSWKKVDEARLKEKAKKEEIQKLKLDLADIQQKLEEPEGSTLPEKKELTEKYEEQRKLLAQKQDHDDQIKSIIFQGNESLKQLEAKRKELNIMEEKNKDLNNQLEDKQNKIKEEESQEKKNTERIESQIKQIDLLTLEAQQKKDEMYKKEKELIQIKASINDLNTENEDLIKQRKIQEKKLADMEKEIIHLKDTLNQASNDSRSKESSILAFQEKCQELDSEQIKKQKKIEALNKKINKITEDNDNIENIKQKTKTEIEVQVGMQEQTKKLIEELKSSIEKKMRARSLLNKHVVKKEEESNEKVNMLLTYENQLKKVNNEVQAYKKTQEKLNKIVNQLEKDKEKYAFEASQAHAKYYQCAEEVRMKEKFKEELQKKNKEVQEKLKNQQKLYECVRSDRNLFSKNLIEANEEIADLQKKYKRMTHQIDQLKEEISNKDANLIEEDKKNGEIRRENESLNASIEQLKLQIQKFEGLIKTHESDINRLKGVISQAEVERQKQWKDYEMVINERDILGNQLIKRNDELALLYEKIKVQQSHLAKGTLKYKENCEEIRKIQGKIAQLKKEIELTKSETACIPDLNKEIHLLSKEVIQERIKSKVLEEELEKPMNIHAWRKIEQTDPEKYEMLMKIQSLQRRLIAKTEEVNEKDTLIQEKENLYVELKNILSKQSGPEVAEKLQIYQENLKERIGQLKNYLKELENYNSQVEAYKFEIQRIDNEMRQLSQEFFEKMKKQEVLRADQIIPEEGDNVGESRSNYYPNPPNNEGINSLQINMKNPQVNPS